MRAAVVVCAAAALLLAAGDTGAAAADLSLVNGTGSALHRRQDRNRAFQLRSLADTGVSYCVTATGGSTSATVVLLECDENRSLQQWTWTSEGYLQSSSTRVSKHSLSSLFVMPF